MSDKLLIDLWGATISADGIYAIVAAVIIVLALVRWRWRLVPPSAFAVRYEHHLYLPLRCSPQVLP